MSTRGLLKSDYAFLISFNFENVQLAIVVNIRLNMQYTIMIPYDTAKIPAAKVRYV